MARVKREKALRKFGANLRAERKRAGLTQAELAKKLGVEHVRISEFERALENPTLIKILEIARALGVDYGRLLDRVDGN